MTEQEIHQNLYNFGILPSLAGFDYITAGVMMMQDDATARIGITKYLYPTLARKHKTTPSRVERAIRHAIGKTGKDLTNKEFLVMLAKTPYLLGGECK